MHGRCRWCSAELEGVHHRHHDVEHESSGSTRRAPPAPPPRAPPLRTSWPSSRRTSISVSRSDSSSSTTRTAPPRHASHRVGSSTVKRAPAVLAAPRRDRPPCRSTIWCEMCRPSPRPGTCSAFSPRPNASNSGPTPARPPEAATRPRRTPPRPRPTSTRPAVRVRVLHGVVDEVGDDLVEPGRVAGDHAWPAPARWMRGSSSSAVKRSMTSRARPRGRSARSRTAMRRR